jgi:hypothetical protein
MAMAMVTAMVTMMRKKRSAQDAPVNKSSVC